MSGGDGSNDNGSAGEPARRQRNMRDTPELSKQARAKRRKRSENLLVGFSQSAAEIHFPLKEMPEKASRRERAMFIAHSIGACLDRSGHSAMLHYYKPRIKRIVHYQRYYKEATCKMRKTKRTQRQSNVSKVMTAVVLNSTVGCVQVLQSFRAVARFVTGEVSSLPTASEAAEGAKMITDRMTKASPIMASRDGHYVSLRSTVEMDLLRLEQTPKTSKCVRRKAGHKRGISIIIMLVY